MTVAEELQMLQIIREALSNAVRHSQASYVQIMLACGQSNLLHLSIEDDGVGINLARRKSNSHGIIIMQERAQALKGDLRFEQRRGGGPRLLLTFTPAHAATSAAPVV